MISLRPGVMQLEQQRAEGDSRTTAGLLRLLPLEIPRLKEVQPMHDDKTWDRAKDKTGD